MRPLIFSALSSLLVVQAACTQSFCEENVVGVTVASSTPEYTRKGEGDFIELGDGRFLIVYMEFSGAGDDFATTRLVAQESSDGGKTWVDHRVVTTTTPGDINVYSPNLIRSKDGAILLAFMRQHRPQGLTIHVWKSTNEGRTFEPFSVCLRGSSLSLCNATIKRLKNGRLLLPASPPVAGMSSATGPYAATVIWSDDDGMTWIPSKSSIELPMRGAMEPHVEEKADGRILMVMRSQLGKLHFAESADNGESWSTPFASDLSSPESCPELVRFPDSNDLLLIWNNTFDPNFRSHFGKRSPLTAGGLVRPWENMEACEKHRNRSPHAPFPIRVVGSLAMAGQF